MYKTPSSVFFWTKIHLCSGQVPGSTGWGLVGVLAVGYVSSLKHSYTIWFACTDFPLHATRKDVWWRYLPFGCRSVCSPWSITKWSSGKQEFPEKQSRHYLGSQHCCFLLCDNMHRAWLIPTSIHRVLTSHRRALYDWAGGTETLL